MPKPQRYTKERVKAALIEARGFQTMAAEALGCEPNTVTNYLNRYPELREVLRQEREKTLDFAELQLLHAIKDREPWAVALYLKTIGKDRGYVERQEQNGRYEVESSASGVPTYGVMVVPGMLMAEDWQRKAQQHYEQRRLTDGTTNGATDDHP